MIAKLKQLEPELDDIELICNLASPLDRDERFRVWRLVRELLYSRIGFGRPKESVFMDFSTDPVLYSSEAWCCVTEKYRTILL